jgi:hypothetical protein
MPNLWGGVRVEVTISVSGITLRLHIEEECFLSNPDQFAYDDAVKTLFVKGFLRTDKSSFNYYRI